MAHAGGRDESRVRRSLLPQELHVVKRRSFVTHLTVGVIALGVGASPSFGQAHRYLTDEQALRLVFPNGEIIRDENNMTDAQLARAEQTLRLRLSSRRQIVYRGYGGYAMFLNEIGKDQPITMIVGVSEEFRVIRIALVVFRESRGWEVEDERFCRQFRGKSIGDRLAIGSDIVGVTGATLSSRAFCRGARKALAICEAIYR